MNTTSKSSGDLGVTAGTQVVIGKSVLTGVNIHAAAADVSVTIYDNTSAAGKILFHYTLDITVEGLGAMVSIPDVRSDTGLFVVTTGVGAGVLVHYK